MRIPKKGAAPPAPKERKANAEKSPKEAVANRRQASVRAGEPLGLSEAIYDRMFRGHDATGPKPARRTTARVQRAFADAFLDEAAPTMPPLPTKGR